MEPRQASPEQGAEIPQYSGEQGHSAEQFSTVPMEGLDPRRNEQTERRLGQHIEAAAQLPQLPTLPAPVVVADSMATVQAPDPVAANPLVAADDDLIEKEWVDKAKQIIATTKDDPFLREQEVKKLQIDYVRKRYGREIGDTND